MDPLTIIVSALAFIDPIQKGIQWYQDAKSARNDYDELSDKVENLRSLLSEVKDRAEALKDDPAYSSVQYVNEKQLSRIKNKLKEFAPKLKPLDVRHVSFEHYALHFRKREYRQLMQGLRQSLKERSHVAFKSLFWTFKKDEYKQLFQDLGDYKLDINTAFVIGQNRAFVRQYNETKIRLDEDDYSRLLKWLSSLNFYTSHERLRREVCPRTGKWLLENSPEFLEWERGDCVTLDCYGMSGAGKTYMSSMVVDHLNKATVDSEQVIVESKQAVLYLYLDHKANDEQTLENLLRDLLKQLLETDHDRGQTLKPELKLKELYQKCKNKEVGPDLESVRRMLSLELGLFDRTFVIIDALDECDDGGLLREELRTPQKNHKLSLWFTERSMGIEECQYIFCNKCSKKHLGVYYRCSTCKGENQKGYDICQQCYLDQGHSEEDTSHVFVKYDNARLEIRAKDEDVREYVSWELQQQMKAGSDSNDERFNDRARHKTLLGDNCRDSPKLKTQIEDAITKKANGQFLHAKLYIESLKDKYCEQDVIDALNDLPERFEDIYDNIMNRVKSHELALELLSWIVCTKRPLLWSELEQAMAVRVGDANFKPKRKLKMDHLLKQTAGLITVDPGTKDSGPGKVHLIHESAQAYFNKIGDKWFSVSRAHITRVSLTYLSFPAFAQPCSGEDKYNLFQGRKSRNPFFAYAATYWGAHAQEEARSSDIWAVILRLLSDRDRLASLVQALYYLDQKPPSWDVQKDATPLHLISWFGLDEAISQLLRSRSGPGLERFLNTQDITHGRAALIYACRRDHASTVQKLIAATADVNIRDSYQKTALFETVFDKPKLDTLQELLKADELDVNMTLPRKKNRTVLMLASQFGYLEIVKTLLHRKPDLQINQQDADGFTALSLVASGNRAKVMELLLNRPEIDTDALDMNGGSALMIAAARNAAKAVTLLLKHKVDISLKDTDGKSALGLAISKGNMTMIQELIDHHGDLLERDYTGRSLLHNAIIDNREDAARIHC